MEFVNLFVTMWKVLESFGKLNKQFLQEIFEVMKYSSNDFSVIPSLIFLFSNFVFMYWYCHRYTRIGYTSLRAWLCRELTFHWSYFYLSKLWFIFMRIYKISTHYVCNNMTRHHQRLSVDQCYVTGLCLLTITSMIPTMIFLMRSCSRTRIPNFLLWIGEDPWLRTEIGLAGHYLERPPRFRISDSVLRAFRCKRSTSIPERARRGTYVRLSKSVGNVEDTDRKLYFGF